MIKFRIISSLIFLTSLNVLAMDIRLQVETDDAIKERVQKQQYDGAKKEFKNSAGMTALLAAGTAATAYFTPEAGALVGMGGIFMIKDHLTTLASFYGLYPAEEKMQLAKKLNEYEEKFELYNRYFPESNQKEIAEIIKKARTAIGYGLKSSYEYEMQIARNSFEKLEIMFSLPTKNVPLRPLNMVTDDIKCHLKTYSDKVADSVMKAVTEIYNLSSAQLSAKSKNHAESFKASYLFLGEAGVGKTETAKKIAKVLNRSFCKINMSKVIISNLYGVNSIDPWAGKMGKMGELTRCFVKPDDGIPAINPIIFIDEIHDVLNHTGSEADDFYSFMKLITEGNETSIKDVGLGIEIDISKAIFIFAANVGLIKDASGALATRLTTIDFSNLSEEQKKIIGEATFKSDCMLFKYNSNDSDHAILETIITTDKSPGARVLKATIRSFINHQKSCEYLRCKDFNVKEEIVKHGGQVND